MWLLDHNVSVKVKDFLTWKKIEAKTASEMGWEELSNGNLVEQAIGKGFSCLLTRDQNFEHEAHKSLARSSDIAIVKLQIKQGTGQKYIKAFSFEWDKSPINPEKGEVIIWPFE